ncbi:MULTISPECIES: substrate-binding domain-containing protein [Acidithiobacillus]|jgi:ABC-type molybdate transport system substrate-binding protein|uniref:Sulfate-binding protein n=3 Tax=Acidithiobacillus TaxID=119977 RepID=A0A2Z6IH98_ACIFI|nr:MULTISPECIES: substrate-binding domain-containing protein [Acidithiobacillus]MBU2715072.1 ABC transporter substrate-binding protein [Acidithiobacillus ferridurans]MBU2723716.1 ABC transporter substrate-binding protein [Acidithiobacillus ferridurans]MBU2726431.1 ABC transporter substrate-binding protein [Acidithiobacillus ferridurans]MBU2805119.1 ABC transporter substrate-binding protein [Acidithiobacillus ferridurans]MBU2815331.1 ABC transporter substrate-binding protein [Acidithiobacillus 
MKKSKTLQIATVAAVASLLSCGAVVAQAADMGWNGKAEAPRYQEQVFPPWQHGENNPTMDKGFNFTVPEIDDLADFHGSIDNPQLTIFVGGNYYFAMAPLVKAFEKEHPALRGKIYYETLPPGILIKQMKQGGTITIGNMTWTVKPDVYAAGLKKVNAFIKEGLLQGPAVPYVTNDLTIMIPKGNPAHITGLQDLGKPGVRLSMPNPAWEGVARQIKMSLTKAGGPALEKMVYDTKVKNGETILTHIHHRQTPLFLMQGLADAGVTWKSEAIFQEQAGHPIANVAIPAKDNTTAIYASAVVKGAAHPKWAKDWVNFLKTPTALQIFEHYGFKPYTGK